MTDESRSPRTEAGRRLVEEWGGDGGRANIAAILAIEAEAAAPRSGEGLLGSHPDAGNEARNHYDWFMPSNPTAAVDDYLDEFEAKLAEALTDPFVHDMAQSVLPLIAAYRQARAAAPRSGEGLDEAWAEVEAALPEGVVLEGLSWEKGKDGPPGAGFSDQWVARAYWWSQATPRPWVRRYGEPASEPAAALHQLAARLRENTNA